MKNEKVMKKQYECPSIGIMFLNSTDVIICSLTLDDDETLIISNEVF